MVVLMYFKKPTTSLTTEVGQMIEKKTIEMLD